MYVHISMFMYLPGVYLQLYWLLPIAKPARGGYGEALCFGER